MQSIKDQITDKLDEEFSSYEAKTLSLAAIDIYNKSYETTMKKELHDAVTTGSYLDSLPTAIQARLLSAPNLLDFLYETWLDSDTNISEYLEDFLFYAVDSTTTSCLVGERSTTES